MANHIFNMAIVDVKLENGDILIKSYVDEFDEAFLPTNRTEHPPPKIVRRVSVIGYPYTTNYYKVCVFYVCIN